MLADVYLELLDEIYKAVPTRECHEGCTECCGAISYTVLEAYNMRRYLNAHGIPVKVELVDGKYCPYLNENRCGMYPVRPLICRLYGVCEGQSLECIYSDPVQRRLTKHETADLYRRVNALDVAFRRIVPFCYEDLAPIPRRWK